MEVKVLAVAFVTLWMTVVAEPIIPLRPKYEFFDGKKFTFKINILT